MLFIAYLYHKNKFIIDAWYTKPIIPLMFYVVFVTYTLYCVLSVNNYKKYIFNLFLDKDSKTTISKKYLYLMMDPLRKMVSTNSFILGFNIAMLLCIMMILIVINPTYLTHNLVILSLFLILCILIIIIYSYLTFISYKKYQYFNALLTKETNEFILENKNFEFVDVINNYSRKWWTFKYSFSLIFIWLSFCLGVIYVNLLPKALETTHITTILYLVFVLIPFISFMSGWLSLSSKISRDKSIRVSIEVANSYNKK
ncbi:hypothetical protein GE118_00160 [Mycoplasma sp. NEAQ87857]|uniref:hypothetical protein n=1 Tax=Mycoplasma sp. NEAQ87857 TaxID=2683967 RepID=UPI001315CD6E|nr:hypothetical protein [Mycoplasma sp. NEAQ87857]QGZ97216.1 hypothetical protein GE118_00160 [Mycoplasma sp. NEAQ87857]